MTNEHGEHTRGLRGLPGEDGKKGEKGDSASYLSRSRTLALFGFVVLAFLLLAVRSEINANNIRQGVYENCVTRAVANAELSDCERFR